jgi:death on curing protein
MILIEDILTLHKNSILDYGGLDGIRDEGFLQSAIARPFQTFGGEDLYSNVLEKAAALGESLIINHPFVDGNKRTGMAAMYALLLDYGIRLTANSDDFYNTVISISTGELNFEQIVTWLKANTAAI